MELPKFLLVDTKILPEVYYKVVYAKRLIAQGKAKSSSEAAKLAGISRSAFYKYKDCVHQYNSEMSSSIVTFYATLEDQPGVLSSFLSQLHQVGANILTINQNIPVDGVAPVSISAHTESITVTEEQLMQRLNGMTGVVEARIVTR